MRLRVFFWLINVLREQIFSCGLPSEFFFLRRTVVFFYVSSGYTFFLVFFGYFFWFDLLITEESNKQCV